MTATAKIFMHGRSQAVRLPKAFRLPGKEARVSRIGHAVLLEPLDEAKPFDAKAFWARIDALGGEDLFVEGPPADPPPPPSPEFDDKRSASTPTSSSASSTAATWRIRERFEERLALGAEIALPAISLFEMRYGPARSHRRAQSDRQLDELLARGVNVIPFEAEDAGHAGEIRAALAAKGTPIAAYDILIAAQARRRCAALVTANTGEFEGVPGLLVVDWGV